MALLGIILNSLRETMRQPFYLLLLAGGVAALLGTLQLPFFTQNDTDMYKDLGLSFILLFAMLVGLLAAATGVAREVEDQTAQTILAKPLGRTRFIVGKFLGAVAAVAVAVAIMGAVFVASTYYRVEMDVGVLERPYTAGGVGVRVEAFRARQLHQALTVTPGLVLVLLQVGVLASVATALSTRLSPAASVGLGLAAYLVGHLAAFVEAGARTASGGGKALVAGLMAVLPYLEIFNINSRLAHGTLTPLEPGSAGAAAWSETWAYVGWSALYAAAYATFAVGLGVMLFRRRSIG